jgi:hypothetical protein
MESPARSTVATQLTLSARRGALADEALARAVCRTVEEYAGRLGLPLVAYCLLGDDLDVMVAHPPPGAPGAAVSLERFTQLFRDYTGHMYTRVGGQGTLWQRSAVVAIGEDEWRQRLSQMIQRPVRRNLVERWDEWPYTRVYVEMSADG